MQRSIDLQIAIKIFHLENFLTVISERDYRYRFLLLTFENFLLLIFIGFIHFSSYIPVHKISRYFITTFAEHESCVSCLYIWVHTSATYWIVNQTNSSIDRSYCCNTARDTLFVGNISKLTKLFILYSRFQWYKFS